MKALLLLALLSIPAVHMQDVEQCSKVDISRARRRFAYEFYSQIQKETAIGQNIMLSPTTLGSALSMVLVGSRGSTKTQIMKSLFGRSATGMSDATYSCLVQAYADPFSTNSVGDVTRSSQSGITLRTASKLYGEKTYRFNTEFVQLTKAYRIEMEEVDFARSSGPILEYINTWVSDATDGNIQNLFNPSDITAETVLAIVSAVYFEGMWKNPFQKQFTSAGNFERGEGDTISADFMSQTGRYKTHFSAELDADMLEMPYERDERHNASMVLLLPATSMQRTEEKLNDGNLAKALLELFSNIPFQTRLSLPKFEVTYEHRLSETLAQMGMTDLLSPGQADLGAMLSLKNRQTAPLYLQTAIHKTVLKIDEEGSVGAGATGLGFVPLSLPQEFNCNKPFLTLVYEKNSENVIFIGRISNPPTSSA